MTVKRVEWAAEAHGAAAAAAVTARAKAIAARQVRPLPPDPQPDMLYIVIDGTGVLATGKETAERDGKSEDGRAQIREAKLAVFFPKTSWTTRATPVRRHHHPPLPAGQQTPRPDLVGTAQPDRRRLTSRTR